VLVGAPFGPASLVWPPAAAASRLRSSARPASESPLLVLARILGRNLVASACVSAWSLDARLYRIVALDRNQLHLKNQSRIRPDSRSGAALTVCQIRWNK